MTTKQSLHIVNRRKKLHSIITQSFFYRRCRFLRNCFVYTFMIINDFRDYLLRRHDVSFLKMIKMWRSGFTANKLTLYDLTNNTISYYISDVNIIRDLNYIYNTHRNHAQFLDTKFTSISFLKAFVPVPEIVAIIMDGTLVAFSNDTFSHTEQNIFTLLSQYKRLVIIPNNSIDSVGLHFVDVTSNGNIEINGRVANDIADIQKLISSFDDFVVLARIQQAYYAEKIYPQTSNTIRLLTIYNSAKNDVILAAAVHKFGTSASFPAETFREGGLLSRIDLDTGQLCETYEGAIKQPYSRCHRHPDTGIEIAGTVIPHWDRIKRSILETSRRLPFLPYIGWDILVTNDGFVVIEGNTKPGIESLQLLQPLLRDPDSREAFSSLPL